MERDRPTELGRKAAKFPGHPQAVADPAGQPGGRSARQSTAQSLAHIADVAERGDLAVLEKIMEGRSARHIVRTHLRTADAQAAAIENTAPASGPSSPAVALEREQRTAYREYRLDGGLILDMPKFDAQAEPAAPSPPANDPAGGELDVVRSDIRRLLASGKGDLPRLTEHEGKHAKVARSRSTSWPRSSRQEPRQLPSAQRGARGVVGAAGLHQNVLLHRLGRTRGLGLSGPEMLSRCCPVNAAC